MSSLALWESLATCPECGRLAKRVALADFGSWSMGRVTCETCGASSTWTADCGVEGLVKWRR